MTATSKRALSWIIVCLVAAVALCGCAGGSHSRAAAHTSGSTTISTTSTTTGTAPGESSTAGATTTAKATTTAGVTTAPSGPAPVTYGLGDAQGQFAGCTYSDPDCCNAARATCDRSVLTGYFANPLFLALTGTASAHRVREVRLFVAYDAVAGWNGSTTAPGCSFSTTLTGGYDDLANGPQGAGLSINDLIAGIIEARADGLTPVVSIAGYPYASARPPTDASVPDPTTTGGYWAYRCGIQGILGAVSRLPRAERPHIWEALNEPDGFTVFQGEAPALPTSCQVGSTPQPDGPAKAACEEIIATRAIHGFADHHHDTVIAGTFKHPDPRYLGPYVAELALHLKGGAFPQTWSVHDYGEVTDAFEERSGATELRRFDEALARDTGGRARSLWITESGTVLTSGVRGGDCPASGVDAAGTLGACVNGSVARQAQSAAAFFALPQAADAVPITHLFWYQFIGAPKWDSGLLDATGVPRPVYCSFMGSGTCTGNPDAAS